MVQDLTTQWIQSYSCKIKTSQETEKRLRKVLEPSKKAKVIYTDNSLEFGKACEDLSWQHRASTPHRSVTNGIAERAVRRIKEGTGDSFQCPVIPFGSMVEYHPISAKDQSRLHQLKKKVSPGMFLGFVSRGEFGKGDILVGDVEELDIFDTSEIHARRPIAKDVITPKKGEHFILPIGDVTVRSRSVWSLEEVRTGLNQNER